MTPQEIAQYSWQTYTAGFIRPVNTEEQYIDGGYFNQAWAKQNAFIEQHTYPTDIEAWVTVKGEDLELVWQYNVHLKWKDLGNETMIENIKDQFKTRQLMRLKPTAVTKSDGVGEKATV